MEKDVHRYHGTDIEVSYDSNRCIHVRACVEGLPEVFDPEERPWVDADGADADRTAAVVEQCPTGALQYTRLDGDDGERPPDRNTVTASADGPLYIHGDVDVRTPDGDPLLADTRLGLCRCGRSGNKPLCDNSHSRVFEADGDDAGAEPDAEDSPSAEQERSSDPDRESHGPLTVTPQRTGPFVLDGPFDLRAAGTETTQDGAALCRCGRSGDKPFCDGTHAEVGFTTGEGE